MRYLEPTELSAARLGDGRLQLVDVRQPEEWALVRLPDAILIPLDELTTRLHEIDTERPVVLYCHHGVRSELAGRILERSGHTDVAHLVGGIDAWSRVIDPGLPRY